MPRGLKETSSLITISAIVTESAPGAFTTQVVDLTLNPLDNEVFIVYGVDLDLQAPELIAGATTLSRGSISSTTRTGVGNISDSNVIAAARIETQDLTTAAVTNEFKSDSAPSTSLEYLGIISTNNFHLNVQGSAANPTGRVLHGRVFGVRARADPSVYAALVQSELLSQ